MNMSLQFQHNPSQTEKKCVSNSSCCYYSILLLLSQQKKRGFTEAVAVVVECNVVDEILMGSVKLGDLIHVVAFFVWYGWSSACVSLGVLS